MSFTFDDLRTGNSRNNYVNNQFNYFKVRLGTIGSEEELKTKVEEFALDRLKELLDAETKLRNEANENCSKAESRLTESKGKND